MSCGDVQLSDWRVASGRLLRGGRRDFNRADIRARRLRILMPVRIFPRAIEQNPFAEIQTAQKISAREIFSADNFRADTARRDEVKRADVLRIHLPGGNVGGGLAADCYS